MHDLARDLFLPVFGVVLLAAAGVIWLFTRSNHQTGTPAPLPAAMSSSDGTRLHTIARLIFFGLFALSGVCLFLLPAGGISPKDSNVNQPLSAVLANPDAARNAGLFALGFGCFFLLPIVEILGFSPRSFAPPWNPKGRVWSCGGRPVHGYLLAVGGVAAIAAAAYHSVGGAFLPAALGWVVWIGWLCRSWLVIDEIGVIWSGMRFRWHQVVAWKVVYHPGSGGSGEDGGRDWYELIVTVADGVVLSREDRVGVRNGVLSCIFDKYVPEKREAGDAKGDATRKKG